jgi:hypothetical protein
MRHAILFTGVLLLPLIACSPDLDTKLRFAEIDARQAERYCGLPVNALRVYQSNPNKETSPIEIMVPKSMCPPSKVYSCLWNYKGNSHEYFTPTTRGCYSGGEE